MIIERGVFRLLKSNTNYIIVQSKTMKNLLHNDDKDNEFVKVMAYKNKELKINQELN